MSPRSNEARLSPVFAEIDEGKKEVLKELLK